ncbi:MAG: CARDB domain-containing protein [Candidatus Nanoarchaeia archaeon]
MIGKKYMKLLIVLALIMAMSSFSFAIKDFTLTTAQNNFEVQVDDSLQFEVDIENTGDEPINLTINQIQFVDGSNTIMFNPNQTTITNLNDSQNPVSIEFTNASMLDTLGSYSGDLIVVDSQNSSLNKTRSFTLNVVDGRSLSNPTINVPDSISQGDDVTFSVDVSNNGSVDLEDVDVSFEIPSLSINMDEVISSINIGSSQTVEFDVSIPQSATSQQTTVNVEVDYANNTKQVSASDSFFLLPEDSVFFEGFEDGTIEFDIDLEDRDDTKRLTLINEFDSAISDLVFTLERDIGDFEIERHIEFEESRDDTLDVDDEENRDREIGPNGGSYLFSLEFDRLDEIEIRNHFGSQALCVEYQIQGESGTFNECFDISIDADKDDVDVEFIDLDYEVNVERGSDEDIDIEIDNNENFDVEDMEIQVGDEFRQIRDSSKRLSTSNFEFDVSQSFRVDEGVEDIELNIRADDRDDVGTYEGTLVLLYKGEEVDEITIEVKITDGVTIESVNPRNDAVPGERLVVDVIVNNENSLQEVDLRGEMRNVNSRGQDLTDSETTLISSRDSQTMRLSFDIPDDVRSNDLLLELELEYDDPENRDERVSFTEEMAIMVDRDESGAEIRTAFVVPNRVACDVDQVDSRMTFRNSGIDEEDFDVTSQIVGVSGTSRTQSYTLLQNEERTVTRTFDISQLNSGNYNVEYSVNPQEGDEETQLVTFTIDECDDEQNGGGDSPSPGDGNQSGGGNGGDDDSQDGDNGSTGDDSQGLFSEVDTTTIILLSIAGILLILIIVVIILLL